jgi:heat shock protein HslJ
MAGSAGCSTFRARNVAIDPPRLRIGEMTISGVQCPDKQTQLLETAFFNALGRAEFIELDGGRLVLRGAQGALIFEQVLGTELNGPSR